MIRWCAGRSIFLCSFVAPLEWPQNEGEVHELHLLRVVRHRGLIVADWAAHEQVSTIPFIEDWVAFDGDYDVRL